jgi:HPt (histidine-containing phosphotransfer) domain-containing protein
MKKSHDHSARPVWNLGELLSRVDHDQELLRELVSIFKAEFPPTLQSLQTAVAAADLKKAASLSHTLKGMLSNLGGTRAADAASRLEALASAGEQPSLKNALELLEGEAACLVPEIEAYLAGVRG